MYRYVPLNTRGGYVFENSNPRQYQTRQFNSTSQTIVFWGLPFASTQK